MRTALGRGWKWLLGAVLGMLGFSGCEELGMFKDMYGSPYAYYKLVGDVKDAKGNPIQGIRVVYDRNPENEHSRNDTLYTDSKGHFEKEKAETTFWRTHAVVRFEDVDGSAHGSFKTKTLGRSELSVKHTEEGSGSWYSGKYTVTVDAVLEAAGTLASTPSPSMPSLKKKTDENSTD